jgi:release factor glutamine methyltransferase
MNPTTLSQLLKEGTELLRESAIEEAGLDAWLLLEYTTDKSRAYYYAHTEEEVTQEQETTYRNLIRQRAAHIPLQHLTHQAFFMGYEFYVNEHVLVPRQDTETLVEKALKIMEPMKEPVILDMCTGSGCILLSLLLERQDSSGYGVDLSGDALAVAIKNAERLGVADRAVFIKSDLFSYGKFQEIYSEKIPKYDILISNPPYIPTEEIEELMEEVRFHDPRMALDGKEDGLYFYREITRQSVEYLKPGGWLLYEIGCSQGEEVAAMMRAAGYEQVQVLQDLAGLDRVVCGRKRTVTKQEENHV